MACTNVFLNSSEYTIYANTELKTRYSLRQFNRNDYEKGQNSSVRLCFPFNETFLHCAKWKFSPGELNYDSSDRTLTYGLSDQSYSLGNYVINDDNSVYLCVPEKCLPPSFNVDAFFVFLWSLSICGLLLSIILYYPRTLNRNHLKPPLLHMISLLFVYVFLILLQTSPSADDNIIWKTFLSFGNIYSALTAYAWLNVIGYDAWKQFHPKMVMIQPSVSTKYFTFRTLYALGLPLLLTCTPMIAEWSGCCEKTSAVDRAGLKGDLLNYIIVIGGITALIVTNLIFFGMILFNLKRLRKELKSHNTNVGLSLHNIRIPVRLFTVMGLVFVCVIIAYILGPSKEIYLSFFDAVISLQGVFLFLIYGINPLIKKFRTMCPKMMISNSSQTRSSQKN